MSEGKDEPKGRSRPSAPHDEWTEGGPAGPPRGRREAHAWPSEHEVEGWAERERERRQRWAGGPTEEEKAAWAYGEARRRRAYTGAPAGDPFAFPFAFAGPPDPETARLEQRYRRDAQLALEGAFATLWRCPFRMLASMANVGRAWEEEGDLGSRPRRVPLYDDDFYDSYRP